MSSSSQRRTLTFKAAVAITKGQAVKMGADNKHVTLASAATDKIIGVANHDVTTAEDVLEVNVNGGGGKFKAGGSVSAGDLLTSDASGNIVATTTPGNRIVGVALEDAVSGDIFAGEVAVSLI